MKNCLESANLEQLCISFFLIALVMIKRLQRNNVIRFPLCVWCRVLAVTVTIYRQPGSDKGFRSALVVSSSRRPRYFKRQHCGVAMSTVTQNVLNLVAKAHLHLNKGKGEFVRSCNLVFTPAGLRTSSALSFFFFFYKINWNKILFNLLNA